MYKIVNAINQQVPATLKPGQLLILTKFAELLPQNSISTKIFRLKMGEKDFMAITHYKDRRNLVSNLDDLDRLGLLVCLEKREKKKLGDEPTLYELRLPEGYNEAVATAQQKAHVYSGKRLGTKFYDSNAEFYQKSGKSQELAPVAMDDVANSQEEVGKIHPTNNHRSIDPTTVSVVDDEDIEKAVAEAVELTRAPKSKFKGLNITAETLQNFRDAMAFCRKQGLAKIKKPFCYLRWAYKMMVAGKLSAPVQANPNAPTSENLAQKAIEEGWAKIVEGLASGDVLTEDDKAAFVRAMKTHKESKIPIFVNNFVEIIQFENGGSFEALKEKYPVPAARRELLMEAIEKEEE